MWVITSSQLLNELGHLDDKTKLVLIILKMENETTIWSTPIQHLFSNRKICKNKFPSARKMC